MPKSTVAAEVEAVLGQRPDLAVVKLADGMKDNWTFLTVLRPTRPSSSTSTMPRSSSRAYAAFPPGNETNLRGMLELAQDLIASGAPERQIVEILSSDGQKSGLLTPLIVALRQRGGEKVRAPVKVLEVAADVRKRIESECAAQAIAFSISATNARVSAK